MSQAQLPFTMRTLLEEMVQRKASDLHVVAGSPPIFRIDGELVRYGETRLTPEMTRALIFSLLNDEQRRKLEDEKELDFAVSIQGLARFRANVFFQRGTVALAIRVIPYEIPSPKDLRVPEVALELIKKNQGLILVTGPTGSGKSTTLASLINVINETQSRHIITIEDPIEFLHRSKKSLISQREVHVDTKSFANALRSALREDPDVILVGEMRDLETIGAALTAAETGHLVFATLHTPTAPEAINRIVDVFPPHQQTQIRVQLAAVLEAVITQRLLPARLGKGTGKGRVLATEVLIGTPAVRNIIRENRIHELYSVMQTSQKEGMHTMNQSLYRLYREGHISWEIALQYSPNPADLERLGSREGPVRAGTRRV